MTISDAEEWFGIYYSQNQEDLILKSFFPEKKDGFYVDVGAHDPEFFSVTKMFYDMGWSGINIEPQKSYFQKLNKQRTRDINLNIAVGSSSGVLDFREYPDADGLSTLSSSIKKSYANDKIFGKVTKKYNEYKVDVKTLASIFSQYCKSQEVHFLKIDVEGFEKEVLLGNDWEKFRPFVICIEANHELEKWHGILNNARYEKFFFDGLNQYFVAKEKKMEIVKNFSYVSMALSRIPLSNIPFKMFAKEIRVRDKELKKLNELIKKQDEYIKQQEKRIQEMRGTINSFLHRAHNYLHKRKDYS